MENNILPVVQDTPQKDVVLTIPRKWINIGGYIGIALTVVTALAYSRATLEVATKHMCSTPDTIIVYADSNRMAKLELQLKEIRKQVKHIEHPAPNAANKVAPFSMERVVLTDVVKDKNVANFLATNEVLFRAFATAKSLGINMATIVAQKILESGANRDRGISSLCLKTNNLGNVKCKCSRNAQLRAMHAKMDVCVRAWDKKERSNDYYVKVPTAWQGWNVYKDVLKKQRYSQVRSADCVETEAWALQRCRYATDKHYAESIIAVVRQYNLLQLQEICEKGVVVSSKSGTYIFFDKSRTGSYAGYE